jgi:uncharacterized protein (DUF305 family)
MNLGKLHTHARVALVPLGLAIGVAGAAGCETMGVGINKEKDTQPTASTAPYDLQFIDTMVEHHRQEIELARLVDKQATMPELKAVASHLIRDDGDELARLTAFRAMWYGSRDKAVNPSLPGVKQSTLTPDELNRMKNLTGAQLDRTFIDHMIAHHRGGIALAEDAQQNASRQELKTLADEIVREETGEIDQLQQWRANVGKTSTGTDEDRSTSPSTGSSGSSSGSSGSTGSTSGSGGI